MGNESRFQEPTKAEDDFVSRKWEIQDEIVSKIMRGEAVYFGRDISRAKVNLSTHDFIEDCQSDFAELLIAFRTGKTDDVHDKLSALEEKVEENAYKFVESDPYGFINDSAMED